MKYIIITTLSVVLTSCGNFYQNPVADPTRTAVLKNKGVRNGLFSWVNYSVTSIDNMPVNYNNAWSLKSKKMVLSEGNHKVVLHAQFNRALGHGPFEALGDMPLRIEPGKTYITDGRIIGSRVSMWISNERTGKRVSVLITIPYQRIAVGGPYPMYIPVAN